MPAIAQLLCYFLHFEYSGSSAEIIWPAIRRRADAPASMQRRIIELPMMASRLPFDGRWRALRERAAGSDFIYRD